MLLGRWGDLAELEQPLRHRGVGKRGTDALLSFMTSCGVPFGLPALPHSSSRSSLPPSSRGRRTIVAVRCAPVLRRLYVSEPLVLKPDRTQARLRSLAGTIIIAAKAGRLPSTSSNPIEGRSQSSRVGEGRIVRNSNWYKPDMVVADNLSPQKAAILLSLA